MPVQDSESDQNRRSRGHADIMDEVVGYRLAPAFAPLAIRILVENPGNSGPGDRLRSIENELTMSAHRLACTPAASNPRHPSNGGRGPQGRQRLPFDVGHVEKSMDDDVGLKRLGWERRQGIASQRLDQGSPGGPRRDVDSDVLFLAHSLCFHKR